MSMFGFLGEAGVYVQSTTVKQWTVLQAVQLDGLAAVSAWKVCGSSWGGEWVQRVYSREISVAGELMAG